MSDKQWNALVSSVLIIGSFVWGISVGIAIMQQVQP